MQPSNLSQEMKTLEGLLNVKLFHRTNRGFLLTQQAKQLSEKTNHITSGIKSIMTFFEKEDNRNSFMFCVPVAALSLLQSYYIETLRKVFPSARFLVCGTDKIVNGSLMGIDICLTYDPKNIIDGIVVAICETDFVLCTTTKYAEKVGLPKTEEDLLRNHHVCISSETPCYDPTYKNRQKKAKLFDYYIPTYEAQISLIRKENLITRLPRFAVETYSDLIEIKIPETVKCAKVHMIIPKSALNNQTTLKMCKTIVEFWKNFSAYHNVWESSILANNIKD